MATRIIYGLAILAAVIAGLTATPEGKSELFGGVLPLVMVVLGVAYAVMNIDAANPQAFLTTALAVWLVGHADVLDHVLVIGGVLGNIMDQVADVYLAGGAGILAVRAWNILTKGSP